MNILEAANLPEQFGLALLLLSLALLIGSYLDDLNFGFFRIPWLSRSRKKKLKIIGPILFLAALVVHFPLLPQSKTGPPKDVNAPGWITANWTGSNAERAETVPSAVVLAMKKTFETDPIRAAVNCVIELGTSVRKERLDNNKLQFLNACHFILSEHHGTEYAGDVDNLASCFFAVAEYRLEHGVFDPLSEDNFGNDTTRSCVDEATSWEEGANSVSVVSKRLREVSRMLASNEANAQLCSEVI